MDRIDDEPVWLGRPDIGHVFIGREAAKRLEPAGKVVGSHEVGEVRPELIMAFVVEAFDGRFFDGVSGRAILLGDGFSRILGAGGGNDRGIPLI